MEELEATKARVLERVETCTQSIETSRAEILSGLPQLSIAGVDTIESLKLHVASLRSDAVAFWEAELRKLKKSELALAQRLNRDPHAIKADLDRAEVRSAVWTGRLIDGRCD